VTLKLISIVIVCSTSKPYTSEHVGRINHGTFACESKSVCDV